jgi:mono/diheme cytochrome c family protein
VNTPGWRWAAALAAPIVLLSQVAIAQQGQPPGAVAEGRRLAQTICAACHVVAAGQRAPTVLQPPLEPPSFMEIMQNPSVDALFLRAYITTEHVNSKPPVTMPNLKLSDNERDALVSYLMSLRRHP